MSELTPQEQHRARLRATLAATAATIRFRFEQFVDSATSDEVAAAVEASLEANNASEAVATIAAQLAPMRIAVAEAFTQAGDAAMAELAADPGAVMSAATVETAATTTGPIVVAEGAVVGGGGGATAGGGGPIGGGGSGAGGGAEGGPLARIGISFDPVNQRAADIMRREADNLIKQISTEQVEVIREIIAESFLTGRAPRATAQAIKESIGLTRAQEKIVENYRRALEDRSAHALNYQLRNRAKDGTVERAVSGQRNLSQAQIDRMVEQYRKNFVRHRAETIARTESTRVTSLARDESYRQIADKLGIGHNRIIRVWNATEDDRTRDWHADMDGDEASLGQPFTDGLGNKLMFPGDPSAPAATVINCRCVITMRIAE